MGLSGILFLYFLIFFSDTGVFWCNISLYARYNSSFIVVVFAVVMVSVMLLPYSVMEMEDGLLGVKDDDPDPAPWVKADLLRFMGGSSSV